MAYFKKGPRSNYGPGGRIKRKVSGQKYKAQRAKNNRIRRGK